MKNINYQHAYGARVNFEGTLVVSNSGRVSLGNDLIKSIEDKDKRAELAHQISMTPHIQALAQIEVNKAEAMHRSPFVAGWRPMLGYICGFAIAYHFIFRDLMMWGLAVAGVEVQAPPKLDIGELPELVFTMLGNAGYRSWEKVRGKTL